MIDRLASELGHLGEEDVFDVVAGLCHSLSICAGDPQPAGKPDVRDCCGA